MIQLLKYGNTNCYYIRNAIWPGNYILNVDVVKTNPR